MHVFSQLIKAQLENQTNTPASLGKGFIYFQTTDNKPFIDDGTTVDEMLMRKHLQNVVDTDMINGVTAVNTRAVIDALPRTAGKTYIITDEDNRLVYDDGTALKNAVGFDAEDTLANLQALGRVRGKIYFDTTNFEALYDDGTELRTFGGFDKELSFSALEALPRKQGALYFAVDQSTAYVDDGTNLVPIGTKGSVDIFAQDTFIVTRAADFTKTGTITIEDVTVNPIGERRSIKITQAVGSLGAKVESPIIDLGRNQKETTIGNSNRFVYSGNDDDIIFYVLDVTNNERLVEVFVKKKTKISSLQAVMETLSTTNQVRYGFEVATENDGAVLEFGQVEWKVNPFPTAEFVQTQSSEWTGNGNSEVIFTTGQQPFTGYYAAGWTNLANQGGGIYEIDNSGGFSKFTMLNDATVDVFVVFPANGTSVGSVIVDDVKPYFGPQQSTSNYSMPVSITLDLKEGQTFYVAYSNFLSTGNYHAVSIVATRKSPHVVFGGQVSSETKEYIPPANVLGTNNIHTFTNLEIGREYHITGQAYLYSGDVGNGSYGRIAYSHNGESYGGIGGSISNSPNGTVDDLKWPVSIKFTAKATTFEINGNSAGAGYVLCSGNRDSTYFQIAPTDKTISAIPVQGGQAHFLGNVPLSNGTLDGAEFWTGRKINNRRVMQRIWKVAADTGSVTYATTATGLEVIGKTSLHAGVFIIGEWYQLQLANYAFCTYTQSTGEINIITNGETVRAGANIVLEYLE